MGPEHLMGRRFRFIGTPGRQVSRAGFPNLHGPGVALLRGFALCGRGSRPGESRAINSNSLQWRRQVPGKSGSFRRRLPSLDHRVTPRFLIDAYEKLPSPPAARRGLFLSAGANGFVHRNTELRSPTENTGTGQHLPTGAVLIRTRSAEILDTCQVEVIRESGLYC